MNQNTIRTETFLRSDICNILKGLAIVAEVYPSGDYRKGYAMALVAVAVAFGIEPS